MSKGGNLLLNVGPTARGTFDERALERLPAMGGWMKLNWPSIYGCTRRRPEFKAPDNSLLTYNPKTNRLYVHLLVWPMGEMVLEGYGDKVKYAQLLHDASEVRMSTRKDTTWIAEDGRAGDLVLRLPVLKPDTEIPVIELQLK